MQAAVPESDSPVPESAVVAPAKEAPVPSVLHLLAQLGLLVASVGATLLAIVMFTPDGNDYALATLKKHARLDAPSAEPKIVLVGGSNLAYGVDSAMIERATGARVVNMGMNGYLGVRYMLEEVRPHVVKGDTVVISLEYDSFFKTVEGTGRDLLLIVKANPEALSYLNAHQKLEVLKALPFAAQQKVLRLIREGSRSARSALTGHVPETDANFELINGIETLKGFNEHGDLTSHLNVRWPGGLEGGIDMTRTPVDGEIIGLLESFTLDMKAKGVRVIYSYGPVLQSFYDEHKAAISSLYDRMRRGPLVVPSPPTDFVHPEHLFFDTVFHLNKDGRVLRTQKVIDDLERTRAASSSP